MDATVFTTLGVGVGLAAIVLTGQRSLRTEIAAVETRLGKRIARLGDRVDALVGSRRRLSPDPTPDESPA